MFSVLRSDYYLYFDDFFVVAGLRVNHKRVVLEFVSSNSLKAVLSSMFYPETLEETIESSPLCITGLFQNKISL